MRRILFVASLLALPSVAARADSTTIGASVTSERVPGDFTATKSTDWEVTLAHTFDSNLIIAAGVKYYDTANTTDSKTNVQALVGYTHDFGGFALTGMIGAGQHFISADTDSSFPYYVATLAANIPVTDKLVWTAARLRYRNAFDTRDDYNTPEIATGINYRLDAHGTVTLFVTRDWSDGEPNYNGIELGYKHSF
ncbi:hypothetical protein [Ancylobacter lacus]|uniref:hypothetical protein n=1 Tax=Ancylobacter lacus TaxID=2579970 RepID=UPI001BCF4933|nr:hypothetical protein [Ancylobacter lacus]MBS7540784.1 hypothetical protein [Ancylobacter lacus]